MLFVIQLERVCCLSGYPGGRQLQTMGPAAPLIAASLDLDMNIYSRHFTDPMMSSCTDHHMIPMSILPPEPSHFPEGGLLLDDEKLLAMKLAASSLEELVKMCTAGEPLWMKNSENGMEMLNAEERARLFPWPMNFKQNSSDLRTEATRDTAVVIMNSINLVDAFLDANKWMELFPSIVSKAKTVQVISADPSGQANGSLQLVRELLNIFTCN